MDLLMSTSSGHVDVTTGTRHKVTTWLPVTPQAVRIRVDSAAVTATPTSVGGLQTAPLARMPDPRLRSIVACKYAGWTLRPDRMDRFVVPAHTSVQLVFKVEDSALRPPEFVHGAAIRHTVFEGGCAPRYLQVELTPLGAYRAFGIPMHHIAGQLADLADVVGRKGRRLGDQIRNANTWRERFDAIDRFLVGQVAAAPVVTDGVAFAWEQLMTTGGAVPIRAICREVGWSQKHLIARFRQQTGLTPKRAARVIRFERVLRRISGAAHMDLARLAAECGYSDQAHLIRDFGEFTGMTPGAAVRQSRR
jgi:AraC-like DNA-binding protein